MKTEEEVLTELKSIKRQIEKLESKKQSLSREKVLNRLELRFETLAWLFMENYTSEEYANFYNSL